MPEKQTINDASSAGSADVGDIEPVRKSIRVRASAEQAFRVFTEEMDSWWPRTHHIGTSPMTRVVVEGWPMGAIYSEQEDGTTCSWGTVLIWDPPHRFVMAWRVDPAWQYEMDLAKCSEVELRFLPTDDGVTTLVELEHRDFQRHGTGGVGMREQVNAEGGWGSLLAMFAAKAEVAS
jgi:Activator of Hsp90 ATPase homolog 1-like protein